MASVTISQLPTLVTSTDANSTELDFSSELQALGIGAGISTAFIEVVSGTFNFSNFGTASSSNGDYVTGDKLILTFGNGKKISFKAANSAESFKISI